MTDVLELAHVTRKSLGLHVVQSALGQPLWLDPQFTCTFLQEMLDQQRDVLAPLPERRQTQTNHVESVKEIFPEHALSDTILKILVRRGNDSDVCLDRLMPTDAIVMPIGEHTQKTGLELRWHVADFIEKQCPTFRLLETTPSLGGRTGKGAPLVPEQFRLEQIPGMAAVFMATNGASRLGL